MSERLKVAAHKYLNETFFAGVIEDVIERLQVVQRDHPGSRINWVDQYEFVLEWTRDETDSEYTARKAAEIKEANEKRIKLEKKIARLQEEAAAFGIRVSMEK